MHTANIVYKQFMSFIKTYKCLLWHNATHMVRNGVQGVRKTRTRKLKNFIVLCKQTKKAIVKIDTSKLTSRERGSVQAILDKIDSPFSVSQRRRKEDLIDDRLREVKAGSHTGAYKFDYSETADL